MITHGSTFSGIGAPEIAADMLGWENVFHCEINSFGRKVLDYHFPNSESYEDITKTDFSKWRGRVTVLTGGFPCQPFSYAGKRRGSEDDRYLWPYMLKCIEQVRPTWFVGENVAGITTMAFPGDDVKVGEQTDLFGEGDGIDIYERRERFVLSEIISQLEGIGYSVQAFVIPACAVGAPHRRDRIFIVAHISKPSSNTNGSDNTSGRPEEAASEIRGEGLQERHSVQQPIKSDNVRPKMEGHSSDSESDSRVDWGECVPNGQSAGEERSFLQAEQEGNSLFGGLGLSCADETSSYANGERQSTPNNKSGREGSKMDEERKGESFDGSCGRGDEQSRFEDRWRAFPTQSPVYRGNDGIPFDVDSLAIPFEKWKKESLKAYGNAIVPQVMYEIFRFIDLIENNEETL